MVLAEGSGLLLHGFLRVLELAFGLQRNGSFGPISLASQDFIQVIFMPTYRRIHVNSWLFLDVRQLLVGSLQSIQGDRLHMQSCWLICLVNFTPDRTTDVGDIRGEIIESHSDVWIVVDHVDDFLLLIEVIQLFTRESILKGS